MVGIILHHERNLHGGTTHPNEKIYHPATTPRDGMITHQEGMGTDHPLHHREEGVEDRRQALVTAIHETTLMIVVINCSFATNRTTKIRMSHPAFAGSHRMTIAKKRSTENFRM